MWLLAGPIKCNWPSVTLWLVFQYPVTFSFQETKQPATELPHLHVILYTGLNQCSYSPLSGHKKLQKLDDFEKIAILKKGIGIKSQKAIQTSKEKYRNKMELSCCYATKFDSKAFAIPVLTASACII